MGNKMRHTAKTVFVHPAPLACILADIVGYEKPTAVHPEDSHAEAKLHDVGTEVQSEALARRTARRH